MNSKDRVIQKMALVQWFKVHPDRDKVLQPPLEIWEQTFVSLGKYNFLPIKKILYPLAFTLDKHLEMKLSLSQHLFFTSHNHNVFTVYT